MRLEDTRGWSSETGTATDRDRVCEELDSFVERDGPPRRVPDAPSDYDALETQPLHTIELYPEDPRDALRIGLGEESLLDPDAMRLNAVNVGITMQGVGPDQLDPLLEAEYDGLLGIRRGALEALALHDAGGLAAIEAATDREVAALTADGLAAADDAARQEARSFPRLEQEADKTTKAHEDAVTERDSFEKVAIENRDHWTNTALSSPPPRAALPLAARSRPAARSSLAPIEVVVGGLVLSVRRLAMSGEVLEPSAV